MNTALMFRWHWRLLSLLTLLIAIPSTVETQQWIVFPPCQIKSPYHHHHQVPDLEQTLATMPLQTSLSSDNFKKFKPLLCPPVAELQRLSRNVIRCLPLSRLPSTLPVKDKNSKPLRLHTCPKNSICLFLIVFNSDLWTFPSLNTFTLVFFSVHEIPMKNRNSAIKD